VRGHLPSLSAQAAVEAVQKLPRSLSLKRVIRAPRSVFRWQLVAGHSAWSLSPTHAGDVHTAAIEGRFLMRVPVKRLRIGRGTESDLWSHFASAALFLRGRAVFGIGSLNRCRRSYLGQQGGIFIGLQNIIWLYEKVLASGRF